MHTHLSNILLHLICVLFRQVYTNVVSKIQQHHCGGVYVVLHGSICVSL